MPCVTVFDADLSSIRYEGTNLNGEVTRMGKKTLIIAYRPE